MVQIADALDLTSILEEPIDWRYKSFPAMAESVTIGAIGEQGWRALDGDLLFPALLLKERALQHNVDLMARWCRDHGVSLAPHGKTPVAPQIVQRQLDAGAWGITAATIHQARVFRTFGVQRILLANELLEPAGLAWVAGEMARDRDFEFLFLVDSEAGVALIDEALSHIRPVRPLRILFEVGAPGGRSGIRNRETLHSVARAVHRSLWLIASGVEGYEGAIHGTTPEDTLASVDRYLMEVRASTEELVRAGIFDGLDEIIVSAGGSYYFDRVAELLAPLKQLHIPARIIIRSGSYVTHDFDSYENLSALAGRGGGPERLVPALELWAMVLSCPEPGLAIAGAGKRDAPYDLRLPAVFAIRRDGQTRPISGEIEVTALNDQHAFLRFDPGVDVAVGDLVGLDIAHPCTSFDKWRLVPVVDEGYGVVGAVRTFF